MRLSASRVGPDVRRRADDGGDGEADAVRGRARPGEVLGVADVPRADVAMPGGEGAAIESDDEVDHVRDGTARGGHREIGESPSLWPATPRPRISRMISSVPP